MLADYYDILEVVGLNIFFAVIFIFIGLSIHDIMKKNNVPKMGQIVVYFVLSLGCIGFIAKGVIQLVFES